MWKIKKLFLFASLVVGMCVPNAVADLVTDHKINKAVHAAFDGKQVGLANLKPVLKVLMPQVSNLIKHKVDGEYKNLHEALKNLNLDETNLMASLAQLKAVVNHLPKASKDLLQKKYILLKS